MTGLWSAVTALMLAMVFSRRRMKRWSGLINHGADMIHHGKGAEAEISLRAALAVTDSARGPLWYSRRLATLLPGAPAAESWTISGCGRSGGGICGGRAEASRR